MSERSAETGSIRRQRGRRLDALVVVAVLLPLVALAAAALTRPHTPAAAPQAPTAAPLTSAALVCPSAAPGTDTVTATLGAGGRLSAQAAKSSTASSAPAPTTTHLAAGVPTTIHGSSAAQILSASGTGAPTLAASRWSTGPLAATPCTPPVTGQWFTGLGAGPYHDADIELTNPLPGDAVVDLDLYNNKGHVQADRLQGIAVPAYGTVTFDLLHTVPTLATLAVRATVVRGQVAISVRDHGRSLVGSGTIDDWLSGQRFPRRTNLLLGLAPGTSNRLTLANPSDSQRTATLKLVTGTSVFAPVGFPAIQVPAQSVVSVSLDHLLGQPVAKGALGVEIDGSGALTAALRHATATDLADVGAAEPVVGPASLVLPPGSKQLIVAGAQRAGELTVQSFGANGQSLGTRRLALAPQQGGSVDLPSNAALVRLDAGTTAYDAAVLARGSHGATVLPVRAPAHSVLVPAIRPALP